MCIRDRHWFGTDQSGRDVFSRVIWGGRASFEVSALAVIIGCFGGVVLGLLAGFFSGGWLEQALMRVLDAMASIPLLILSLIHIWMSAELFLDLARAIERAGMDYLLIEDSVYVGQNWKNSRDIFLRNGMSIPRQEPSVVASLMALSLIHI